MSRKRNRPELPAWFNAIQAQRFRDLITPEIWADFIGQLESRHEALRKECEAQGIPIEDVRHYWHKSEHFSLFVQNEKPDTREAVQDFLTDQLERLPKIEPIQATGTGTVVVALADFHFGANVKGYLKTPDFNGDIVIQRLRAVVDGINAQGGKEVHLFLLGDFIESFTGVNHANTWQELDMYGANAFIFSCRVLREVLLSKIKNLRKVHIVAGNHDRITPKRDIDSRGDVAAMLAYHLDQMLTVPVDFDYLVLNPIIDGVQYVAMHGHQGMSRRELYQILFQHGNQGLYNVILEGHLHSRIVKKAQRAKQVRVLDQIVVEMDNSNYRKITVPPMFTGNFYSTSNGWASSAGYCIVRRSGAGVDHLDLQA